MTTPIASKLIPVVALIVALTSCIHKDVNPIITPVKPKAPAESVSAAPTADKVERKTAEADSQSAVTEERVARAKSAADEAKAKMRTAVEEADRLRKQKSASENELLNLYNQLVAQDQKMGSLLTDLTGAQSSLFTERKLRKEASDLLALTRVQIAERDAETTMLRAQLAQANAQTDECYKNAQAAADSLQKVSERAATEAGRTKTWRNIAVVEMVILLLIFGLFLTKRAVLPF